MKPPDPAGPLRDTSHFQATPHLPKSVCLALQGGGAWGAYTWGVLDALLASPRIDIDSISGTSAGALNGAIVAAALGEVAGKARREARSRLASFWQTIASPAEQGMAQFILGPAGQAMSESFGQWLLNSAGWSPYAVNPLGLNPLRAAIAAHVDMAALHSRDAPELFVTVTHVKSGLPRVLSKGQLSVDALLASACLPQLFHAVELDGEHYWDGGYAGNPTLWPMIRQGGARDIILVQLAPEEIGTLPREAAAISRRVAEITFNSSLIAEMQAIAAIRDALRGSHRIGPAVAAFADVRLHRIGPPPPELLHRGSGSQRSWSWLCELRDAGRSAARHFLRRHFVDLGHRETLDIVGRFQTSFKPKLRIARPVANVPLLPPPHESVTAVS